MAIFSNVLLSLAVALLPFVTITLAGDLGFSSRTIPSRYIVGFKEGVDAITHTQWVRSVHKRNTEKRRDAIPQTNGIETIFRRLNGYMGSFDSTTIGEISASPDVAYVEADQEFSLYQTTFPGLVTQTNSTWGLALISHRNFIPNGTDYVYDSSAGEDHTAYVLDTGINTAHTEFGGRASLGYNAVGAPEEHYDHAGHGTHVAGTIGSTSYGVAKKANLVSVKVSNETGYYFSALIDGIDWVLDDAITHNRINTSVINISGGGPSSTAVANACLSAHNQGLTIVAAAGNGNRSATWISPAGGNGVIAVASVDRNRKRAELSNWGPVISIFAPGEDTLSTWIGSETAVHVTNGTSMASPHVAGAVLYLQKLEGLGTPDAVRNRLIELSTKDVVGDDQGSPNRLLYIGAA